MFDGLNFIFLSPSRLKAFIMQKGREFHPSSILLFELVMNVFEKDHRGFNK
jgi:hypothetical protein